MFKRNTEKREKVLQSELFKKIKADPRNDNEIRKMLVSLHTKKDEKYLFYVDGKLQEFSANIVSSVNFV